MSTQAQCESCTIPKEKWWLAGKRGSQRDAENFGEDVEGVGTRSEQDDTRTHAQAAEKIVKKEEKHDLRKKKAREHTQMHQIKLPGSATPAHGIEKIVLLEEGK